MLIRLPLIILVLLFVSSAICMAEEPNVTRKWRDASGKFEVVAELVGVTDGRVKLRKADGRIVTPPLSLLSPEDQDFVSAWEQENSEGNIFAGGMTEAKSVAAADRTAPSDDDVKSIDRQSLPQWREGAEPVVFTKGRDMVVQPMGRPQLKMADSAIMSESPGDEATILIPPLEAWEEADPPILIDQRSQRWIFSAWQNRWNEDRHSRIVMIDSRSRQASQTQRWEEIHIMYCADPASGRVIGQAELGDWGTSKAIGVWSCSKTGKFRELVRFRPTPDSEKSPAKVQQTHWIDDTHVVARVVARASDTLLLWDIANRKIEWQIALNGWHSPAISVDGARVAVQNANRIGLFETASGQQLGTIELPTTDATHLAFSISGLKLSAIVGRKVRVFDLQDPSGDHEFEMPEVIGTRQFSVWTDENHLLLDGKTLVDPRGGFVVWTYDLSGTYKHDRQFSTGLFRGLQSADASLASFALAIPHEEAMAAKANFDVAGSIRLRPGDSVNLQVDASGSADASQITAYVTTAIQKAGWIIDPSSSISVKVRTYRGVERKDKYGSGAFKDQELPYRPYVTSIELHDSQELLYRIVDKGRAPSNLEIGLEETLAEAIERQTVPNDRFFQSLDFPSRLLSPEIRNGLGTSKLDKAVLVDTATSPFDFPPVPESS